MQLLKFRIIGHPDLADSSWLDAGPGLHVVRAADKKQPLALLHTLQTINPPYDCARVDPFGTFPSHTKNQGYSRKIIPAKKTAAVAIFAALPQLVDTLAAIDPVFYEANWIEIGRRRDYSRWMNFVELPGAVPWSEIAALVIPLFTLVEQEKREGIADLLAGLRTWRDSDRVRGEAALRLKAQLRALQSVLPATHRDRIESCVLLAERSQRFALAKDTVFARLPLFLSLFCPADPHVTPDITAAMGNTLAVLINRLQEHCPERATLLKRVEEVNRHLATSAPDSVLRFHVEGDAVCAIDLRTSGLFGVTSEMRASARTIEALLTGMTALHTALYDYPPVFLLATDALRLGYDDRVELFRILRRLCATTQCFLLPDDDLLALCVDAFDATAAKDGSWLRFIDL